MSDCKLSNIEAIALFVNLFCAKLFLITPKDFTDLLGAGAILFILVMYLITFLLYWFYTSKNISKAFSNKVFLTLLSFFLIIYGAIILSRFVYFTKTIWFLRSPPLFTSLSNDNRESMLAFLFQKPLWKREFRHTYVNAQRQRVQADTSRKWEE